MKRFCSLLLSVFLLTASLGVQVSAASYEDAAKDLAAIGMMKGDASGFALDRAPTRAEAAIMLVRLFGAEDEAKAAYADGTLTHGFTDVSDTAAPHVAWLTVRGIANGTSATTFGASNPCTSQMYTTFLLRALGYQDKTDFEYADAQAFAMTKGMLDFSAITGEFLRDDLAAMTYQALGTDLKDGSTYLLDSLIKNGAVDAEAAKPMTDKIEACRALQASSMSASQGLDTAVDAKMGIGISMKSTDNSVNMDEKMEAAVKGNVKVILDKDFQMAMDMTVDMKSGDESESQKVEYWLKDGVMYVRAGDEAYQMPMGSQMDMETLMALIEQTSGKTSAAMLPFIDTITSKTSGDNTVYTLTLNDAFAGLVNRLLGQILNLIPASLDVDVKFSVDKGEITYTIGKDDNLKDAALQVEVKADVQAADGKDSLTVNVVLGMDMTMKVNALGKDVKITYPDFSGFEKLENEALASIGGADGPTSIFAAKIA